MKIKRTELLAAVQRALPGVETGKTIIEGADTLTFDGGVVHSFNDSISVSSPFPGSLKGAVRSEEFFKLLTKMTGEEVNIETKSPTLWGIECGNTKAEIVVVDAPPILEYISSLNLAGLMWKPIPDGFMTGVALCKIASSTFHHRGIFCTGTTLLSTDGRRLNRFTLKDPVSQAFWIDDPAVAELLKMTADVVTYSVSQVWVHFQGKSGAVFSCKRKVESAFPVTKIEDLLKINEKTADDVSGSLPEGIKSAVDRVAVFAADVEGNQVIQMTLSKDRLVLHSKQSAGTVTEEIAFAAPVDIPSPFSIYVDSAFLMESAGRVKDFYLKKNGSQTNLVFFTDQYRQINTTFEIKEI
jgi:hypothetical protein